MTRQLRQVCAVKLNPRAFLFSRGIEVSCSTSRDQVLLVYRRISLLRHFISFKTHSPKVNLRLLQRESESLKAKIRKSALPNKRIFDVYSSGKNEFSKLTLIGLNDKRLFVE